MRLPTIAAAAAALLIGSAASAGACNLTALQHGTQPAVSPVLPASMLAKNHKDAATAVSIVGFWRVNYKDGAGHLLFASLQQWHSDNTEFEFADIPTIPGDICMGVWTSAGRNTTLWHTAWTFDSNGNPSGTMVLTGVHKLSADGNTFTAPFDLQFFNLGGTMVAEIKGVARGDRLTVPD